MHGLDPKNMKFKYLIDEVDIDFWFFWNFACMENIIRIYNSIVKFSKFTFNKKIYEEFERFLSKLVWRETFSFLLDETQYRHMHNFKHCVLICPFQWANWPKPNPKIHYPFLLTERPMLHAQ